MMKKHSKKILCQNNFEEKEELCFEEKEKLCFEKKGEFIFFFHQNV